MTTSRLLLLSWLILGAAYQDKGDNTAARRASAHVPAMSIQEVSGAGHLLQLDDPEVVVAAVVHELQHRS